MRNRMVYKGRMQCRIGCRSPCVSMGDTYDLIVTLTNVRASALGGTIDTNLQKGIMIHRHLQRPLDGYQPFRFYRGDTQCPN